MATTFDPTGIYNSVTLSGGNLVATGGNGTVRSTDSHSSGKKYFEISCTNPGSALSDTLIGLVDADEALSGNVGYVTGSYAWRDHGSQYVASGSTSGAPANYFKGDVVMVAVDFGTGEIWYGKNGVWNSGDPAAGTSPAQSGLSGGYYAAVYVYTSDQLTANFGATSFAHSPPSGFSAWGESGVAGSLSVTDAQDEASFDGDVIATISGDLAVTEANDSIAISGLYIDGIAADLSVTDSQDTMTSYGGVVNGGSNLVVFVGANSANVTSTSGRVWYSEDNGSSWTEVSTGASVMHTSVVQCGNGGPWVIGSGTGGIYTTEDFTTFTLRMAPDGGGAASRVRGLHYNSGTVIAVRHDGKIYRSTNDGASWTLVHTAPSSKYSVTYGNGTWVTTGLTYRVSYSTNDGVTWTDTNTPGSLAINRLDVVYKDSLFFANGTTGAYSGDGVTWTLTSTGTGAHITGDHDGSSWQGIGSTGSTTIGYKRTASISTWPGSATAISAGMTSYLANKVRYFNGKWWLAGQFRSGPSPLNILTSENGTVWTAVPISATFAYTADVAYGVSDPETYIFGTLSTSEAKDTSAFSLTRIFTTYGDIAVTDEQDTSNISGSSLATDPGDIVATEPTDNVTIFVTRDYADVTIDYNITESGDSYSGTGTVINPTGTKVVWISIEEAKDSSLIRVSTTATVDMIVNEVNDSLIMQQGGEVMPIQILDATFDDIVTYGASLFDGGFLSIYTGAQPLSPSAVATGTLLGQIELPDPAFEEADDGTATKTGTWETAASNTGVAGWFRLTSADGTHIVDGTVTTTSGTGNMLISTPSVTIGDPLVVNTARFQFILTDEE